MHGPRLTFDAFTLDVVNDRLLRGEEAVPLTPKAFAVLRHLVEHSGRLVRKDELLRAGWPDTHVSDGVLKVCVLETRSALGDAPDAPRFIETVPRRGYRFLAKSRRESGDDDRSGALVGRDAVLAGLDGALERALAGARQVVFVAGEAGIGKTAVIEAFLARVTGDPRIWVASGQCLEQYGAGEAYLPVLEALARLGRQPGRERLVTVLGTHAPTWLAQMPWLLPPGRDAVLRQILGAGKDRMLREMAEAVEALTRDHPLVLVLEDLHWSDYSTLDLIGLLARRREPARLLVIGSYRPVEVIVREHPLRAVEQDLQLRGLCHRIPLEFLTEAEVLEYLARRFADSPLPAALAPAVSRRTDGNPLFIVNLLDYLVARGVIVRDGGRWRLGGSLERVGVPESLRQMIEKRIDRLEAGDQRLLEVASVAGIEFSAADVAAALDEDVAVIEERCEALARREQFLRAVGLRDRPADASGIRYGFAHAFYQSVLYDRVGATRRGRLHQRLGELAEAAWGERAGEIAAELAVHFERAGDHPRAVAYRRQAGEKAARRYAYREAIDHFEKGLAHLSTLPETADRTRQELLLHVGLGPAVMAVRGYAVAEVEQVFGRARELCRHVGESPQVFPALWGLWAFYVVRAELATAHELAAQCLALAERVGESDLLVEAHHALWVTLFYRGEFAAARAHLEAGLPLYDPERHRSHVLQYGQDPGVAGLSYLALVLFELGFADQALRRSEEAVALARRLGQPFSLAFALHFASWLHDRRREPEPSGRFAAETFALATAHGFPFWLGGARWFRGQALAREGALEPAVAEMRAGLEELRATGAGLGLPAYLAVLARACAGLGRVEEGLSLLAEAGTFADQTGQHYWEAEMWRLRGEFLLRQGTDASAEAERCFRTGVDVARRQQARAQEVRVAMRLARLVAGQGRRAEARAVLAPAYAAFSEGFGTRDLREAAALLDELGRDGTVAPSPARQPRAARRSRSVPRRRGRHAPRTR